jgi:2-succinyl-6-hydroxy-2,4-cyclohexadiene-1-carboxylate synthase
MTERNDVAAETLVLLHGFGGTRHAWDRVIAHLNPQRYRPLALDLPGHGEAASHGGPITFETCVEAVLAASPERFTLCGYSMGGRIAMHIALAAPQRITRLVLVSSSPGIEDIAERAERRRTDRRLIEELERGAFEDFIECWRAQPLFADEPPDIGRLARADHRRNDPKRLAAAMRGLGTGEMVPLWHRLAHMQMPVAVVAGSRDAKFLALAQRMCEHLPEDSELIALVGGHALLLENPEGVAQCVVSRFE